MYKKQTNKKRRYYKNSLYDRSIYYLGKASKKKSSKYDEDFALGFLDGMYCKKMTSNADGYVHGYIRSSNALETARNVKF